MDRDAALELLRNHHEFPGPFEFRVVVRPGATTSTVSAMIAAAGSEARAVDVGERRSRQGNYVALHVKIHVEAARTCARRLRGPVRARARAREDVRPRAEGGQRAAI
jgi:putative lipoic acid-binding regulatory protein